MKKKILSILLAAIMIVGILPTVAFAEELIYLYIENTDEAKGIVGFASSAGTTFDITNSKEKIVKVSIIDSITEIGDTLTIVSGATTYTCQAIAKDGYTFDKWVISGDYTKSEETTVKAVFVEAPATYTVTIDSNITYGSVTATPAKAASGTDVTLTVTPDNGYQLKSLKCEKEIKTLGDLMELQTNFPADEDNGWAGYSKTSNKLYYAYHTDVQDTLLLVRYEYTWTGPLRTSELTPVANGYEFSFDNGKGCSFTVTFTCDAQNKIISITITGDSNVEDTYAPTSTPEGSSANQEVSLTQQPDGTYTFTMPAANVTVTAEFEEKVATPTADPAARTYYTAQSVELTTTTDGATIYYTTDDTTPTTSSTEYTAPIAVNATTTIKAIAVKAGLADSDVLTATYTITNRPSSGGGSTPTVTVPVSGDSNSVKVEASVSGSTATVKQIKDADLAKVTEGESVAIDLSGVGKNVDTAKIPTQTVEKIAEKSALTVKLPVATVEFDKAATEEIADQAKGSNIELVVDDIKEVSLNAVQKETVKKLDTAIIIDAHLASNGSRLCTAENGGFGSGKANVILPYEIKNNRTAANYSVFYVDDAGKLQKLNAKYDEELAAFVFEIEHFSVYAVAYDEYVMPFVDVPETAYYYDAVKWAAANAITSGTDATHFNPLGITSRGQMVTFLWRAAGEPEPAATSCKFTDVKADAYYYKAVLWAVEKGITDGTSETTFSPDMNVSRAQAVTFLARMSGVKDDAAGYTHKFADVKATAYYNNAVAWAYENKITDGTSETTFSPNDDCLRNQIVCFLYRYFVK